MAGLPAEKAGAVRQIVQSISDQQQDLFLSAGGSISMNSDFGEKLLALQKQQQEQLQKVLSPEEFQQYDLRAGSTAEALRSRLAAFNPTEDEFVALYRLQKAFDDQHPTSFSMDPEHAKDWMSAQQQLKDQISLALGPQRAAEYEKTGDYSYRQTSQLVTRLELPPETTNQLYDVQKEFAPKIEEAMKSAQSPQERTERLQALQKEALERITPLLGAQNVDSYKRYGGTWLNRMLITPGAASARALSTGG
jgi:hypothetical protein